MNDQIIKNIQNSKERNIFIPILLTIPLLIVMWRPVMGATFPKLSQDYLWTISASITLLFLATIFFLLLFTKKTYKLRKLLFIIIALSSPIFFMESERWLNATIFPCHIYIFLTTLPRAILAKTLMPPASLLMVLPILIVWAWTPLVLGKGWCSWTCFLGGFDEGFATLCKKPKIKIDKKWTYLPFAIFIVIIATNAIDFVSPYCNWGCPFRINSLPSLQNLLIIILVSLLFITLVIILPFLTGKRTQCTLYCPFGAFQSLTNKTSLLEIRINTEKCLKCRQCVTACPTLSLDEQSLLKGETLITCTKCGACMDACPQNAISYHAKGTKVGAHSEWTRIIFLYAAFISVAFWGGFMITTTIFRLIKLFVTEHMF